MNLVDTWFSIKDDEKVLDFLMMIHDRWSDEWKYESWSNYDKAIKRKFENVVSTDNQPVSMTIKCDDGYLKVSFIVNRNLCHLSAKVVRAVGKDLT